MKVDPILEELWKIKDDLAREAGYNTGRFLENLRKWDAEHPHAGPVVNSPEELQTRLRMRGATEPPFPANNAGQVQD
jgi:hypothetical protein